MKKKTLFLIGAGVAAYFLYKKRANLGLGAIGNYETVSGYNTVGGLSLPSWIKSIKPWKLTCGFKGTKCCNNGACRGNYYCKNGICV